MPVDRLELPLTCASEEAAARFVLAQEALLSGTGDPVAAADAALALDPGFVLAACARARGLQLAGRFAEARDVADRALAASDRLLPWERGHVAITADLMSGRVDDAFAKLRVHAEAHPRDAVSLSAAAGVFGLIGFSGRPVREAEQLAFLAPFERWYGEDWWFDTALAFALGECDRAGEAIDRIERALAHNPRAAHGLHTWSHVRIEAGAAEECPARLEAWLPDYPAGELMSCHLWWHLALFRLHAGDLESMWSAFRDHCLPGRSGSPPINVFTDSAALLWRAGLAGAVVDEDTWRAVRDYGDQWFPRPGIFVDVHRALPLAALGEFDALAAYADSLREADARGRVRAGPVVAEVVEGFGAFARGAHADCVRRLEPVVGDVVRIGGSRAQRRLVTETLSAAQRAIA